MKRFLRVSIVALLFLTLNFSAKPYTRKDLESFQTGASVAELVLSLPFVLSNNPSENNFGLSSYAAIPEKLVTSALESVNPIDGITGLIKCLKLYNNPKFAKKIGIPQPILMNILTLIAHKIIMNTYPEKKDRIKRRVVRAVVISIIKAYLQTSTDQRFKEDQITQFLVRFMKELMINGVGEYIGEKIIQGVAVIPA